MKKPFRFIIILICLILCWLGYQDLLLVMKNQTPEQVSLSALEQHGAPRAWLQISAITKAKAPAVPVSEEQQTFMLPLASTESTAPRIWLVTPKSRFAPIETAETGQNSVSGLIASGVSHAKYMRILAEHKITAAADTIFIETEQQPVLWRALVLLTIAIACLLKIVRDIPKKSGRN